MLQQDAAIFERRRHKSIIELMLPYDALPIWVIRATVAEKRPCRLNFIPGGSRRVRAHHGQRGVATPYLKESTASAPAQECRIEAHDRLARHVATALDFSIQVISQRPRSLSCHSTDQNLDTGWHL